MQVPSPPGPRLSVPSVLSPRRTGLPLRSLCRCSSAAAKHSMPALPPPSPRRSSSHTCVVRVATGDAARRARGQDRRCLRPGARSGGGDDCPLPRASRSRHHPGTGLLPACIPGTFETYMLILRDFGTMSLADVLTPAIAYARNGYPLVERACAMIATVARLFSEHWPTSAAVYLPRGRVPAPGLLFTSVRHAQTYERILREGSGRRDRRHGTHRYHRQGRQYVHRYAIGRLAAVLPVIPDLGWPLGSRRVCPARWSRASGRARRFRLVWRCATASPTSVGERPGAISRISGAARCSCAPRGSGAPRRR